MLIQTFAMLVLFVGLTSPLNKKHLFFDAGACVCWLLGEINVEASVYPHLSAMCWSCSHG
jgi:hypothetical protein